MTKREALWTTVVAMIGMIAGKAELKAAEPDAGMDWFTTKSNSIATLSVKQSFYMDFTYFADFTFTFEGKTVKMTNKEIFDALYDTHQ